MAWQNPNTDWKAGDVPAASDFNRIEGNIEELDEAVEEAKGFIGTLANLATIAKNNLVAAINEVLQSLNTHKADYTKQIPFATTGGSVNAYTVSTDPALPSLAVGVAITAKFHAQNTGAATLNWNGKGAKPIKKANGTNVASGNLKANGVYTLRYDGSSFILQGEGGEYVKSVQHGTVSMTIYNLPVTINEVDLSKSIILISYSAGYQNLSCTVTRAYFSSSTRFYLRTHNADPDHIVYWTVIEFDSGVNVQSGETIMSDGVDSQNVNINPVNPSRSFLFFSRTSSTKYGDFRYASLRSSIVNSTTINFYSRLGTYIRTINWFVVEFL
jgi:hypothetical protein